MLSAEQIQSNLDRFYEIIENNIAEPRKSQLLQLYKSQEEILVLAPASSKASFHNSFPGGYVDHVIRVTEAAINISKVWNEMGADTETYTFEELVFSAINHDLGKLGLDGKPRYIPNDSEWHVKNQGANYKPNAELPFLPVQDNSLFILQSAGIQVSMNEYIAIKIHDGLYDEANRAYLISGQNESKLRTSLPLILHQADLMASRIEWEKEWLDKVGVAKAKEVKPATASQFKLQADAKKLQSIGSKSNASLLNALKTL
jgi:hypothetical protein